MVTIKDSKIKDILNKIKNKEDISKVEESYLLDRMITGKLFYKYEAISIYFFTDDIKNKIDLKLKKIKIEKN
jgi:hypothetical protein